MSRAPVMPRTERAERHQRIAEAYRAGACSRTVAKLFGMSDCHVRYIVKLYGVARRPGNYSRAPGRR